MKKYFFIICMLFFINIFLYSSEKIILFKNYDLNKINKNLTYNVKQFTFQYLNNFNNEDDSTKKKQKPKLKDIKIFDKPDFSWFKEKNRLEKAFIAIGVVSCTIGFSMFLAGLLNYLVPLNAVTIDGKPIETVQNTYIAIIGVGSGLMAAGIPFIVVGSVRLWLYKKKSNTENQNENNKDIKE